MRFLKIIPLLSILFIACMESEHVEVEMNGPAFDKAIASVYPVGESGVMGTVSFETAENGVEVSAEISGLSEGNHGFHIHEYGDCTAPDGTSAGGHFNPKENEHNAPDAMNRHMGDMGNITADSDGMATISYTDNNINLAQIIGRGVVIHAGEDDLSSQPSGAAGARIGCGVIGIQN